MEKEEIKNFYKSYSDKIVEKRFSSPYPLRRYAHLKQYEVFLPYIEPGMKVLDAGCGEGVLSRMVAQKGAVVTGLDMSQPNIENARLLTDKSLAINYMTGDCESLPFPDNSFDLVVSSHVLEHLPDFDKGLREIMRVTKKRAVVAIPTILNLCSLVQVGGGWFYLKGPRSFASLFIGLIKMIWSLITGKEGVDESYGSGKAPHIFRFPWILRRKVKQEGFFVIKQEASSVCLPFFSSLLPLIKYFDKRKKSFPLNSMGYGTTYIIEKTD